MRVGTLTSRLFLLRRAAGAINHGGASPLSHPPTSAASTSSPSPSYPPSRRRTKSTNSTRAATMATAFGDGGGPGSEGVGGHMTATAAPTAAGTAPPAPSPSDSAPVLLAPADAYAAVVAALGPMSEEPMVRSVREVGGGASRRAFSPRAPSHIDPSSHTLTHTHTTTTFFFFPTTLSQIPPAPPLVLVISGPSGVGKDAALAALIAARPPGSLRTVVTATTRAMRPGEVDGVDYRFVPHALFQAWLEAGALLEHALVYGEYKGIPRSSLEDALGDGCDVALRVDVQGAAALTTLLPGAVRIFLAAESEAALVRRLTARKTEPVDALATRVGTARQEVGEAGKFDYGKRWRGESVKRESCMRLKKSARAPRGPLGGHTLFLTFFSFLSLSLSLSTHSRH